MKVGIVGAGIGGIAAGIRMANRGYEVDVFEANSYPGGKLSEINMNGYRFDAGPSLFTMPVYVDELYKLCDKKPEDYYSYVQLEEICRYFWEDGTRLTAFADSEMLENEIENKLGVEKKVMRRALMISEKKYKLTGRTFLEHNLHSWKTWLTRDVLKALLNLPALDVFSSMHTVNERLLKHPKLVQFFDRFATYNGSNPYKAPGLLNIIPHFEHGFGAFFPKGGMRQIILGLYELARDMGVQFHFEHPVERILVENGTANGLMIKGEKHSFDTIISNMDVFFTYQKLLPDQKHPTRILKQEKSTSALIFYWGVDKVFEELNLHNILFSDDYKTEFEYLSKGKIYKDPTIYINITQKYEKSDAPEGGENWFTMINVPYNDGQNWDEVIAEARRNIIDKINRILGVDMNQLISCEDILDPRSIESRTCSHLGALYGTSSNDRMAAFMRHPNFSSKIRRLYFCGGSVHPGGGIPLSLLSAKIADQVMHERT